MHLLAFLARALLAALVVGLATPTAPQPPDPAAPAELGLAAPTIGTAPASAAWPQQQPHHRPEHRHHGTWRSLFSEEGVRHGGVAPPRRRHPVRHHHRLHDVHEDVHQDAVGDDAQQREAKPSCAKCGKRDELPKDVLTELQIEFVKQQILKKLGLKEPPVVKRDVSRMPKSLAEAGLELAAPRSNRHSEENTEDFYGRTDQVILFPIEQNSELLGRCPGRGAEQAPSEAHRRCFTFKLPGDVQDEDVTRADLWLYKRPVDAASAEDGPENATLTVSEVVNWDLSESFQRRTNLTSELVTLGEGWVKQDFGRAVKSWLEYSQDLTRMVETSGVAVEANGPYTPFLVIATSPKSKARRRKRNAKCVPGMSECCRENLYVNFADIGWDDWILQPRGYEAYFCRGSCTTAASLTVSGSHHGSITRMMQNQGKVNLVPCCTPTKYSEMTLLYINNNSTFIQKTLPNMVVEACGCN